MKRLVINSRYDLPVTFKNLNVCVFPIWREKDQVKNDFLSSPENEFLPYRQPLLFDAKDPLTSKNSPPILATA
jgi:hypothetical protein